MLKIKNPEERLKKLAEDDKKDLIALITYTLIASLLFLAIPLATQALVNTIAAGIFIQPLIVMSIMLFFGLMFLVVLQYLEISLVESIQQKIFTRNSFKIVDKLSKANLQMIGNLYAPELVNRFFDILTIQKTWSKLLLNGLTSILQIFFGLLLISFYSPALLAFDLFIIVAIFFIFFILGKGGFTTSLIESTSKYKVVSWLEEIGACLESFKLNSHSDFLINKTDELVSDYLIQRKEHFKIISRQAVASYLFYAIATTGVFAIGGYLVINRQLTLGQLVASELIIVMILSGFQKIVQDLDRFYDLLSGLEKISYLTEIEQERKSGIPLENTNTGLSISFNSVRFSYNEKSHILKDLSFEIGSNEKVIIAGESGAGKTTITKLLCGFIEPSQGSIRINSQDIRDINLLSLRNSISIASSENEIFEGSIEENITLRKNISSIDLNWAANISTLDSEYKSLPNGLKSQIISRGANLSKGIIQKILIARAILLKPKLLILNDCFTGIDQKTKLEIVKRIFNKENNWTIICITNDFEILENADIVYILNNGKFEEKIASKELNKASSSRLNELFPYGRLINK